MKKLPVGIQNICEILNEGYVYVDKTRYAYALINNAKHYFMSRPRRFGKSLFLNTLEEIFKGNKELFKGLEIYKSDYNWQEYPVLYFDFAQLLIDTEEDLKASLNRLITAMARSHGVSIEVPSPKEGLINLVKGLASNTRLVVLVDEYDYPIINNLKHPEIAEQSRNLLKGFFAALKSLDRYLKLTFVTGVSKFSQVSLFSGPNNLTDITMDPRYAAMMGYTEGELRENFRDHIHAIVGKDPESVVDEIRSWYNGYRFSEEELSVYNPYSTLRFFGTNTAESYWYSSGTPSFLIDEAKKHPQSVVPLSGALALKSSLSDISKITRIDLVALMFQTGFLTIKDYNPKEKSYQLDFPNKEVREAFFNSLLKEFAEVNPLEVSREGEELKQDLENLDLEAFISKMNAHFARMPHNTFAHAKEGFYQAVFYTFLISSGIKSESEVVTSLGRIDLLIETPKTIFVLELKTDKTADIALTQAMTKKYKDRFSQSKKETLVMGINFSSKSRDIGDWKAILYSPLGDAVREILPSK